MPFFSPDYLFMVLVPWGVLALLAVDLWWDGCDEYWQKDQLYPWVSEKSYGLSTGKIVMKSMYDPHRSCWSWRSDHSSIGYHWRVVDEPMREGSFLEWYKEVIRLIVVKDKRVFVSSGSPDGTIFYRLANHVCFPYSYFVALTSWLGLGGVVKVGGKPKPKPSPKPKKGGTKASVKIKKPSR